MNVVFEKCFVCGRKSHFNIAEGATLLRDSTCEFCGTSLRSSDVAHIISKKLLDESIPLCEMGDKLSKFKILSTCTTGSIHEYLSSNPHYISGEYLDGVPSGEYLDGVLCLDLQELPFENNYFDLIISEDVLEHVIDIQRAFHEINRVLKIEGRHIFTVPIHENRETKSRIGNPKEIFHCDPIRPEGALVITDFGNDVITILADFGMETSQYVSHRFFDETEITNTDIEYSEYLRFIKDPIFFYRYNSIVYSSKKIYEYKGAQNKMQFTGERFLPDINSYEITAEHYHRYFAIKNIIKNKIVLDIASGEGYGTNLISQNAKYVYGVDISEETIMLAKKKYIKDNLEYICAQASDIPLKDNSIDVVISFETIEHLKSETQIKFMKEIKRVLKEDGLLIISTPNKLVYSDVPSYNNKYHEKEFYIEEFKVFLEKFFLNTEIFNQKFEWVSTISAEKNSFHTGETYYYDNTCNDDVMYIVVICSDKEVDYMNLNSTLLPGNRDIYNYTKELQEYIDTLESRIKERDEKIYRNIEIIELSREKNIQDIQFREDIIEKLNTKILENEQDIQCKEDIITKLNTQIIEYFSIIQKTKESLCQIENSKCWRATKPIRKILDKFKNVAKRN